MGGLDSDYWDLSDSDLWDLSDSDLWDLSDSDLWDLSDSDYWDLSDSDLWDLSDSDYWDLSDLDLWDLMHSLTWRRPVVVLPLCQPTREMGEPAMKKQAVIAALVLCSCVLGAVEATAQPKQKKDPAVESMREELQIVQEYIEEQGATINQLKKQLGELSTVRGDMAKQDIKIEELKKAIEAANAQLEEAKAKAEVITKKVGDIEDTLKRRNVKWSAQLRVRPEVATNMTDFHSGLNQDENMSVSQRLRVGMDYKATDLAAFRLTLQDVRGWGVMAEDSADKSDPLRVFEAWVDLNLYDDYANLKLGRQVWDFGKGRIIGKSDWTQVGRSFDGVDLVLKYEKYIKADLLFSVIDERNASNGKDLLFGGIYLNSPYVEGMDFDAYWLYYRDHRAGGKRDFSTFGLRAAGKMPFHPALFFDFEGSWQIGSVTEGTGPTDMSGKTQDHFAASYHAEIGYDIPETTLNPQIAFFFDSASGDPNDSPTDPRNDVSTAFIPLFPSRHSYLGMMDIWTATNIWDVGGRVAVAPSAIKGFKFEIEFHKMALVEDEARIPWAATNPAIFKNPKKDPDLGIEVDFCASYQITEELGLATGYSFFAPGDGLKGYVTRVSDVATDAQGNTVPQLLDYRFSQAAHWFFMQADYKF